MNSVSRSDIGRRLAQIRGRESHEAFASRVGVHKNTYGGYERGQTDIGGEALARLVLEGWNVNWLLTGNGPERLTRSAVGEESEAYGASHPVGHDAYILAVTMIDEALANAGKVLESAKRAKCYLLLAELIQEEDDLPNAKVVALVVKAVA